VSSCAYRSFIPSSNIDLKAIGIDNVRECASIPRVTLAIRGGSDRSYDYDHYEKENRDDYPSRYDYGSSNVDGYGTGRGYGHNEDDYGGYDSSGRRRKRSSDDEDDYYGYEREYSPVRRPTKSLSSTIPDVGGILRNGNKKVGMMLLGGGAVFTLLGISLFFNKTLMRLGNLLFIAGVPLFVGPGRTTGYFLQPKKARATGCLALGIFLVLIGWPILGICLEAFGILNLFGNMFPVFVVLLKQMPVIGSFMNGGRSNGGRTNTNNKGGRSRDSYRYEDEDDGYGREDDGDYRRGDGYSDRYH